MMKLTSLAGRFRNSLVDERQTLLSRKVDLVLFGSYITASIRHFLENVSEKDYSQFLFILTKYKTCFYSKIVEL